MEGRRYEPVDGCENISLLRQYPIARSSEKKIYSSLRTLRGKKWKKIRKKMYFSPPPTVEALLELFFRKKVCFLLLYV